MGKARMKRGGNKGKNGETSKRRKTLVQILNEIPNFPESQRIAKLEECIIDPDEWILAEGCYRNLSIQFTSVISYQVLLLRIVTSAYIVCH